jgi:hypothetical protein
MYRYFATRRSPVLRPALAVLFAARALAKAAAMTIGPGRYERGQRARST